MLPLSPFVKSLLFNLNNPRTPLLTASALDIGAHSEAMDLLISDKILTPPPMTYLLQSINDTYYLVLLSELEVNLNNNRFSTVLESTHIVVYCTLLTND